MIIRRKQVNFRTPPCDIFYNIDKAEKEMVARVAPPHALQDWFVSSQSEIDAGWECYEILETI